MGPNEHSCTLSSALSITVIELIFVLDGSCEINLSFDTIFVTSRGYFGDTAFKNSKIAHREVKFWEKFSKMKFFQITQNKFLGIVWALVGHF